MNMTTIILSVLGVSALTLIIIFYVKLKKENNELKKNKSKKGSVSGGSIPGGGIKPPNPKRT